MLTGTKVEIMEAIGRTDDSNYKMILLLMLGMVEEVSCKLDQIYTTDKDLLKESVLNGHAHIHHEDHEWIKQERELSKKHIAILERATKSIEWVERKMNEEATKKADIQKGIIGVASEISSKILWVALGILVYINWPGLISALK